VVAGAGFRVRAFGPARGRTSCFKRVRLGDAASTQGRSPGAMPGVRPRSPLQGSGGVVCRTPGGAACGCNEESGGGQQPVSMMLSVGGPGWSVLYPGPRLGLVIQQEQRLCGGSLAGTDSRQRCRHEGQVRAVFKVSWTGCRTRPLWIAQRLSGKPAGMCVGYVADNDMTRQRTKEVLGKAASAQSNQLGPRREEVWGFRSAVPCTNSRPSSEGNTAAVRSTITGRY
jgi:hypothetical protein